MQMNDTVYQISPDKKIIPKYHLGFHAQGEIADFYEKTKNFDRNKFSESKMELIWTFDFFELDDMFYINYSKSNINKVYISIIPKFLKCFFNFKLTTGNVIHIR